jgi:hypothetical protein
VPCRAGCVGPVPGYRVDTPRAMRKDASVLAGRPAHPSAVTRPSLWPAKPPSPDARATHLGVESRRSLAGRWHAQCCRGCVGLFPEHLAGDAVKGEALNPKRAAGEAWAQISPTDLNGPTLSPQGSGALTRLLDPRPTRPSPLGHLRPSDTFGPESAH